MEFQHFMGYRESGNRLDNEDKGVHNIRECKQICGARIIPLFAYKNI